MLSRHLVCPHCRATLKTASAAGTHIACNACQGRMTVPETVIPQASRNEAADTSADIFFGQDLPSDEAQGPLSLKGIRPRPLQSITLGDFQILRKLGTGAMGAVYLARQRSQQRLVALKVLSRALSERGAYVLRFNREAEVMAQLDHPHIVKLYGIGEEQGLHYLAMEFIDGLTLTALLENRGGQLGVGDALYVILRCANALGHAHELGIIHRDVKPSNIMIGQLGQVKLADLGLARPVETDLSLTESGLGLGTPHYMAPEQARSARHADARSDLYSLGCALYRMLTGALPFDEDSAIELMLAKEQGLFPSARRRNSDVPPRLDLIIDKMLARNPKLRYQTCAELIRDLEGLGLARSNLSFNPLHALAGPTTPVGSAHVEVLLIDEDAGAVMLAQEALAECATPSNLSVVGVPADALAFLARQGKYAMAPLPNLILLGKDLLDRGGLDLVLAVKTNHEWRHIPLIVLTTSDKATDVLLAHGIGINMQISTPEDLKGLQNLLSKSPCDSTVTVVRLP